MSPTGRTTGGYEVSGLRCAACDSHRMVVPGGQRRLDRPRHGALLRRAWPRVAHSTGRASFSRRQSSGCSAVEVDGETDPTFDVPVRRGLGLRARRTGRRAAVLGRAPRAPPAPSGTADSAPRSAGATATSAWRWPSSPTGCGATQPAPKPGATSPTPSGRPAGNQRRSRPDEPRDVHRVGKTTTAPTEGSACSFDRCPRALAQVRLPVSERGSRQRWGPRGRAQTGGSRSGNRDRRSR